MGIPPSLCGPSNGVVNTAIWLVRSTTIRDKACGQGHEDAAASTAEIPAPGKEAQVRWLSPFRLIVVGCKGNSARRVTPRKCTGHPLHPPWSNLALAIASCMPEWTEMAIPK